MEKVIRKYIGEPYSTQRHNITFLTLMISAFVLAIMYPIIMDIAAGVIIFQLMLTVVQLLGLLAIKTPDYKYKLVFLLGILSIATNWANYFFPAKPWAGLYQMLFSLPFFVLVTYQVIYFAMKSERISPGIIYASITGYLLLGVLGAWLNQLIEVLHPGSYQVAHPSGYPFEDLLYFSYISLSTVGYGDIYPISGAARSVSMALGLIGQFYLAIIIAMLIGKYQAGKAE